MADGERIDNACVQDCMVQEMLLEALFCNFHQGIVDICARLESVTSR